MIRIDTGYRHTFREQIKNFCSANELHISYRQCMGTYDHYNIGGEATDVDKLIKYVEQLELERKNKSFWFRLCN